MLGSLVLKGSLFADLGYYFENWNTNYISLSVLVVLILMVSGFFYGKVMERYIKPLAKADCTFLGILFILAAFQTYIFYAVTYKTSTDNALLILEILVILGPISYLAAFIQTLLSKKSILVMLPTWKNLFSVIVGILISAVLGVASSKLTTNNIFFDSIYYLSETIESSTVSSFGSMDYYHGIKNMFAFDKFHDLQGYYYFWGMILRWVKDRYFITESLTPVYMWSASILYWMGLGNMVVSSVNVLFRKWKWKGLIAALLILSPYYTNYFNTTLGFFGNTIRTLVIGYTLLIIYQYSKTKNALLFIPLTITYVAGLCVSSTSFFLNVFACAGLFFMMCISKESSLKNWIGFVISCYPLFHYALIIISANYYIGYYHMTGGAFIITLVLCGIAFLVRKHFNIFCLAGLGLFALGTIGLIAMSFLNRGGEFGYSYYFVSRSLNDMCNNVTSHVSSYELYRNLILYVLLICLFINFKKNSKFKVFLIILGILFLNPLVQPAVSTYLTSAVYSRSFDLIINPFTLIFLISNVDQLLTIKPVNWIVLLALGLFSGYMGKNNWEDYYSKPMIFKDDGYNWEYKVSEDTWDMYRYIQDHLSSAKEKPVFLSQDVSLKGYVSNIEVYFGANDFRESYESEELWKENYDIMTLLYPEKKTNDILVKDCQGDYSKLEDLLLSTEVDYLIMRNTIAIWNEKGWFEKPYKHILDIGLAETIYENETWIILKRNKDYVEETDESEEGQEGSDEESLDASKNEDISRPIVETTKPAAQSTPAEEEKTEEIVDPYASQKVECSNTWGKWNTETNSCTW